MTKGKSLASRLRTWHVLAENLRPEVGRFPQLAGDLEDLAAMHAEALALLSELARLRGAAQSATARLRKLARRGDMLRTRMGAGLKSSLGFEAVELVRYGFRPRRAQPGEAVQALRRHDAGEPPGPPADGSGEAPAVEPSGEPS